MKLSINLHWQDLLVCVFLLIPMVATGIYYGLFNNSNTIQKYLLGDKKMTIVPTSLSLIASTILVLPVETYLYGIGNFCLILGVVFMTFLMNYVYLPVLFNSNSVSVYEYLEKRFSGKVRMFAAFLFITNMVIWLTTATYVFALIFEKITSINVQLTILSISSFCILYSLLGGFKTSVWIQSIQILIITGITIFFITMQSLNIDINTIIKHTVNNTRIQNPDTIPEFILWSSFGGCFYYFYLAVINQNIMQKYLSLPTLRCAKITSLLFSFGVCIIICLFVYCGMLMSANLQNCEESTQISIREKENSFDLLLFQTLNAYPGLTGVFVTGLLYTFLCCLSYGLNTIAGVIMADFYPFVSAKQLTEKQSLFLLKSSVVAFGLLCTCFSLNIEDVNKNLQFSVATILAVSGPSIGLFTIGLCLPWANERGVFMGGVVSTVIMCWFCYNPDFTKTDVIKRVKSFSTPCYYELINDFVFLQKMYPIPYLCYSLIGTFLTMILGLLISFLTQLSDPRDVDPQLLAPFVKKLIRPRKFPKEPRDEIIFAFDNPRDS